jgi:tubulin-like protein CetZ
MFGVIGLGQCGSNIADLFAEKGYTSAAINYSEKDLQSLQHIDKTLLLQGSEGVGKDRGLAIQLMNSNFETVHSFIREHFSQPSIQVIFIIFSTSGGSGSGISSFITELALNEFPDKAIVCVPVLPSLDESVISQMNTLECLQQISELDVCILALDNNKSGQITKNQIYKKVNQSFVELIENIHMQTQQSSSHGNLDERDLFTLLSSKGFANISHIDIANINQSLKLEEVNQSIINSWNHSLFSSQNNAKIIRFGLIFNGQEQLIRHVKVRDLLVEFDNPALDVFEGWYTDSKGDIYTILTGLAFNTDRLKQIEYKTTHETESLQNALTSSHSISYKPSALQIKPVEKQKKALSSILSKYKK